MWEKMDLFCKTLPMPVTVVITYTLNWLKMSTLHVTRAQSCDKNSKFYYERKVVKRVQTLYSARTMSKFRLSWVLYELHLRYGVMQFSCVWKIYSRSLTPNYIRNNVITLTKLQNSSPSPFDQPDLIILAGGGKVFSYQNTEKIR